MALAVGCSALLSGYKNDLATPVTLPHQPQTTISSGPPNGAALRSKTDTLPVLRFAGNPAYFPDSIRHKLDGKYQKTFGISLDSAMHDVRDPNEVTIVALQDKKTTDFGFSTLTYGRIAAGIYKAGDTLSLDITRIGEDPDGGHGFHMLDLDVVARQNYEIVAVRSLADDGNMSRSDSTGVLRDSTLRENREKYRFADPVKTQSFIKEAAALIGTHPEQGYAIGIMMPEGEEALTLTANQDKNVAFAATLDTPDVYFQFGTNSDMTRGASHQPIGLVLKPLSPFLRRQGQK